MNKDRQTFFWRKLKTIPSWVYEVTVLFVLSWTPFFWLNSNQIVLGHDSGFRLDMPRYLQSLWYSWNPSLGFGGDWTINKGFLITQIPETLLIMLTGDLSLGQRLSFVFWFFVITVSMYTVARYFFKRLEFSTLRMTASVMYMFNFFLLQGWFITERAKFSLFAALPLSFLLLYQSLIEQKHRLRNTLLFGLLFFFLNGGSSPPLYGAVLVTFAVISVYSLMVGIAERGWRKTIPVVLDKVGVIAAFGASALLFNTYWVLPQIFLLKSQYGAALSSIGGIDEILNWERVVSKSASFANLFRFQGIPDWYDVPDHSFSLPYINNPLLILLSFVPITLVIFALIFRSRFKEQLRQDKLFYLILLLLIVTVFFAAGSHPPFGSLYVLLIRKLPGFAIFRSSIYKFGPGFWFSFTFIGAYSLNLLLLTWQKKTKPLLIACVVSVACVLVYHYPVFSGPFFTFNAPFSTRLEVPGYVHAMDKYVRNNLSDGRLLLLPGLYSQFPVDSYSWGFWSFDLLPRLVFSQSVVANLSASPESIQQLYQAVNDNNAPLFNSLTRMFGIDHVLWRSDILYHNKRTTAAAFPGQHQFLESGSAVKLEHKEGQWELYKVSTPSAVMESYTSYVSIEDNAGLSQVLGLPEFKRSLPLIVDIHDLNQEVQPKIQGKRAVEVLQPNCLNCQVVLQELNLPKIELPYVRFLPQNPLYHLILLKEKYLLFQARRTPTTVADLHILFAGKRMREIVQEPSAKTVETFERYKLLIAQIHQDINGLSPENTTKKRLALLSMLQLHLDTAQIYQTDSSIIEYIDQQIRDLDAVVLSSKEKYAADLDASWLDKKFSFTVDNPGQYKLVAGQETPSGATFWIDGQQVEKDETLSLSTGTHQLDINLPKESVFFDIDDKFDSNKEALILDAEKKYVLENITPNSQYVVSFDYLIPEEQRSSFSVFGERIRDEVKVLGSQKISDHLPSSKTWQHYVTQFKTDSNDTQLSVFFRSMVESNQSTSLQLKNFSIRKLIQPAVLMVSEQVSDEQPSPTITLVKVDPTLYKVDVQPPSAPFFLLFKESYNDGWRLYPPDTQWWQALYLEPLPAEHFKADTYANVWYIDPAKSELSSLVENGELKVQLYYWPQALFYLAASISVTILGLAAVFALQRLFLKKAQHD